MSIAVFDTHAYIKKLKAVGFTEEQAEVQAQVLSEIIDTNLATKQDLKELEYRMTIKLGTLIHVAISVVAALAVGQRTAR